MNSAKEKAKELVDKYSFVEIANYTSMFEVKQCVLIAVDEIINYQPFDIYTIEQCMSVNKYWQEVKQEIEKL
jgi:hypothetical protein